MKAYVDQAALKAAPVRVVLAAAPSGGRLGSALVEFPSRYSGYGGGRKTSQVGM